MADVARPEPRIHRTERKKIMSKQGHPGKVVDPRVKVGRRLNDLMRQATLLIPELHALDAPSGVIEHAQAGSLSLMFTYSWLTGLPSPVDVRAKEMGWDQVK